MPEQQWPLTDAEKHAVIKRAGPHRTIVWTFCRFDHRGRPSRNHGTLRAVGARIT